MSRLAATAVISVLLLIINISIQLIQHCMNNPCAGALGCGQHVGSLSGLCSDQGVPKPTESVLTPSFHAVLGTISKAF